MNVLIFDFETDSADAKTTRFTELGAKMYFWNPISDRLDPAPFKEFNYLAYEPDYPPLTEKIQKITGITDAMLKADGLPRKEVLEKFLPLVQEADIIMAHKTAFDITVLVETARLCVLTEEYLTLQEKEIICSLSNMEWPEHFTCHKLGHMAWELGIDVKAADLHRASADCELLAKMINLRPFSEVIKYAREPWVYMRAEILGPWNGKGGDGGVQKGIAQGMGFSYETVKGTDYPKWEKTWVGRFKQSKSNNIAYDASQSVSPFRVSTIEGIS